MPAKRLCDASSVLVGVELPISSRFQPSPLASKLLAASQKGEHCASVSPCQYIAYPQQVLCSAFLRRQVLLGTVRPQHWICKGEFVWPNSETGGWGQEKSQQLLRRRRSYKNFSGAIVYTQTHSGRRILVDEAAGQICLQAGNTNRRQQLLGSEDSLGHQQGAEHAEWPSLARVETTQQPWCVLHTGDALVKLSPLFHKGLRGVLTRPRKLTKGRTADPGKKQHPCRRNPEIRSSWSWQGVSGSQTGSGRNTSDCFQHLFTTWQTDPATQHQRRTPVLDYHRRLQQPLTKLGLWAAQQQRRRSGKLDHRKSAHSD